jgi:hypothetical protein
MRVPHNLRGRPRPAGIEFAFLLRSKPTYRTYPKAWNDFSWDTFTIGYLETTMSQNQAGGKTI